MMASIFTEKRRKVVFYLLIFSFILLSTFFDAEKFSVASAAPVCAKESIVDIIAHPDDDLFFQNPTIGKKIAQGSCLTVVYVTSGDAGMGLRYAHSREESIKKSYAAMLDIDNDWVDSNVVMGDNYIKQATLVGSNNLSVVFLGLVDGMPNGLGNTWTGSQSLEKLYDLDIPTMTTLNGQSSYTREELIDVLGKIISLNHADTILTLDYVSNEDNKDHSDHHAVARFALLAGEKYAPTAELTGFLGYGISELPPNVSGKELSDKWNLLFSYAPGDELMCQSEQECSSRPEEKWMSRSYTAK